MRLAAAYILVVLFLATSTDGKPRKPRTCDKHPTAPACRRKSCPNTYRCDKRTKECCKDRSFPEGCITYNDSTGAPFKCGRRKKCKDGYICISQPKGAFSVCCEDCVCYDRSGKVHRKYEGNWTESDGCTVCTCESNNNPKCDNSTCKMQCGGFSEFSPCPLSSGMKSCGKKIQIRKCLHFKGDIASQRNAELNMSRCHPQSPAQCPQPGIALPEKILVISVVLGVEVHPMFSYRWMVHISYQGRVHCGGTILSPRHILTSAHCFINSAGAKLRIEFINATILVKTGKHNVSAVEPPLEQNRTIQNVTMHNDFSSTNLDNDIAIITLDSPLQFNNHTHPINLPTEPFEDTIRRLRKGLCVVVGWGATDPSRLNQMSDVLMQAEINLQKNCTLTLISDREKVTDNMFCASAKNPNKTHGPIRLDSCFGDSGGPLMCKEGDKWYQYGIVSWGPNSCGEQSGVYVKISNYLDWIKSVISTPGGWGEFSGYYPCSAACGGGTKSRVRVCTNPEPIGNGECPDYSFKTAGGDFVQVEDVECNTNACG